MGVSLETFARPFELTDPVSLAEIAHRLKVRLQTPRMWRHRGVMPPPLFTVSGVPVWDWPTVEDWARRTRRLPAQ